MRRWCLLLLALVTECADEAEEAAPAVGAAAPVQADPAGGRAHSPKHNDAKDGVEQGQKIDEGVGVKHRLQLSASRPIVLDCRRRSL